MRFYADECFDRRVVRALRALGADVLSAYEIAPSDVDANVLEAATREDRVLLTQDKDFGALVFAHGHASRGVVLARIEGLSVPDAPAVAQRILDLPNNGRGAFTMLDLEGARVRPLP